MSKLSRNDRRQLLSPGISPADPKPKTNSSLSPPYPDDDPTAPTATGVLRKVAEATKHVSGLGNDAPPACNPKMAMPPAPKLPNVTPQREVPPLATFYGQGLTVNV